MKIRSLLGILVLSLTIHGVASAAPTLDAQGKCRNHGKFVDAKQCAAKASGSKCRDITTKKFAKCSAANTEPVPAK